MPLPGRARSELIVRHPGSALAVAAMTRGAARPTAGHLRGGLGGRGGARLRRCRRRGPVRADPPGPGAALTAYRFTLHRAAGDALLLLGLLHVAVMVAADPFMLDYLGWMMPLHVLVGVVAIVLLALVILGREPALRTRPRWLGWCRLPRLGGPRRRPAGRPACPPVLDPAHHDLALSSSAVRSVLPPASWQPRGIAGRRGGRGQTWPAAGGAAGSGGCKPCSWPWSLCSWLSSASPAWSHCGGAERMRRGVLGRARRHGSGRERSGPRRPRACRRSRPGRCCRRASTTSSTPRSAASPATTISPSAVSAPRAATPATRPGVPPSRAGSTPCSTPSAPTAIGARTAAGEKAGPVKSCAACHVAPGASRLPVRRG